MSIKRVNVEGLARLAAFCHATIAGDYVYVSGTLGAMPGSMDLVEGGTGPETTRTLRNIQKILEACDCSLKDIIKVNVFLADIKTFPVMNEAYMKIMGADPPARITVGRTELALGAAVEIDCVAYKPRNV